MVCWHAQDLDLIAVGIAICPVHTLLLLTTLGLLCILHNILGLPIDPRFSRMDHLHLFCLTLLLFKHTTSTAHVDRNNNSPVLLFNFGGDSWLALPRFDTKVSCKLDIDIDISCLATLLGENPNMLLSPTAHKCIVHRNDVESRGLVGGSSCAALASLAASLIHTLMTCARMGETLSPSIAIRVSMSLVLVLILIWVDVAGLGGATCGHGSLAGRGH